MAQQRSYSFGNFLSALARAQARNVDLGDIGEGRGVAPASPVREQRAALFRAMQESEEGRRILAAFDDCFQTGNCAITPAMAEEFKRLNTAAARATPRNEAQQRRYEASTRSRQRRAGPSVARLTQDQCVPGVGVWVPASARSGRPAFCRRPGSPQGPSARAPLTSLFRRLRRRDPSTATLERCLAYGGNPQLPSNWREGQPITACRSPIRASPGSPRPLQALIQAAVAAGAGPAAVAAADRYDGEDYEYDDEYDGQDQYDGEYSQSSGRGIFGLEDMPEDGQEDGQDGGFYDQYDSRRRYQ